jgi:hypothetical protein
MGLVGSLWNQEVQTRLQRIHQHLARQTDSGERPSKPTRPQFQRRRPGTVLKAITAVLRDQPEGMRVRDIAAAVAASLGEPISNASIKSCLWAHAQGDDCFERLGAGRYRLR